jgi:hypothetical protein
MFNRICAFLDVLNNSFFVDDESDPVGEEADDIQNTVGFGDLLIGVREQGKTCGRFCRKLAVSFRAVEADSQHLHARSFKPGDITLIRLNLFRSTGRGGANVERQHNGFSAQKISQLDEIAVLVRQREIRRAVAYFWLCGCSEQTHNEKEN